MELHHLNRAIGLALSAIRKARTPEGLECAKSGFGFLMRAKARFDEPEYRLQALQAARFVFASAAFWERRS